MMAAALVIGYGSIGSRHARILKQLGCRVAICSHQQIDEERVYKDVVEAIQCEQPDYIVIANNTDQHYSTLLKLIYAHYAGKLLIEKPLFKQVEQLPRYDMQDVFVAYNLRLHPVILELKKMLEDRSVISSHIYHGQYLPNWRPKADYRQTYSVNKRLGGGVIRDLSHELDYACWLFGEWTSLGAYGGQFSKLELDSDDIYNISLITTKCRSVQIQVNYLDRIPQRRIIVNTEHETIIGDLMNNTLQVNEDLYRFETDRDDTYIRQHQKILTGDTGELCTLEEGMAIVQLIEAAEESCETKSWIEHPAMFNPVR
jgi:predicted dehydrogenase